MTPENPDKYLPEKLWPQLEPQVAAASKYSSQSLIQWADLLYPSALENEQGEVIEHALWRGRLGVLYDKVLTEGYECPYDVGYLMRLAETRRTLIDMGITWETYPIKPSVLIEGRNLMQDDLRRILGDEAVEKDGRIFLTVSRMKAWVKKYANKDNRPVDVIEGEMSRSRRDSDRKRGGRESKSPLEKIADFMRESETPDDVLLNLAALIHEGVERLGDFEDDGVEYTPETFKRAQRRSRELTTKLSDLSAQTEASV